MLANKMELAKLKPDIANIKYAKTW